MKTMKPIAGTRGDGCEGARVSKAIGEPRFGLLGRAMSVFTLWSRMAVRAVVALFIAFAAVTPALAELGCIEDEISHSQSAAVYDADGHRLESGTPGEDGDDGASKAPHCGFSHGSHGFAVPAASGAKSAHAPCRQIFETQIVRPLAAFARDGPYHPPQA